MERYPEPLTQKILERLVLDCPVCGKPVHYVGGLGVQAGHWAHAEPAPHMMPKIER